jgi:hypothetical protein
MVKQDSELENLAGIEETLTSTFYEDIVFETDFDDNILRLILAILDVETSIFDDFLD